MLLGNTVKEGGTQKIKRVIRSGFENMPRRAGSLSRVDRNALERDRRLHMKELFKRLAFLLPAPPAKPSLPRLLDQAISHVKRLEERLGMLKRKKQLLEGGSAADQTAGVSDHMMGGSWLTFFTVAELDSRLEVCMQSGSNKMFMLHQVMQVLEEEAAEVVALSYSFVGDRAFCTINAKAVSARIGIETSRVLERLKKLIIN